MSDDLTPVTGPIPIYVRTIPAGVVLDMEALTQCVVTDVLGALLGDDTALWDQLHEVAEMTPPDSAPRPEGQLPFEELVAALVAVSSSRIPLYGAAALELTRKLRQAAAPRAVPGQRGAA